MDLWGGVKSPKIRPWWLGRPNNNSRCDNAYRDINIDMQLYVYTLKDLTSLYEAEHKQQVLNGLS